MLEVTEKELQSSRVHVLVDVWAEWREGRPHTGGNIELGLDACGGACPPVGWG